MRFLVTGATGFIGAHLVQQLGREDCSVAVLVRPESDRWRIATLPGNVTELAGDFRWPEQVSDKIRDFKPDITIHLAWAGVGNRQRNDLSQIDDNLIGTISLLKLAHQAGCRTWVGLGSQAEYGPLNAKLDEEASTRPSTLYGATKLSTCLLTKQLCEQFGMRFVWLRIFSAYGPMDDPAWLIPYLTLSLLRGDRPSLTAGEQLWDYVYAGDVADAIYSAAITDSALGIFNLGSGQAYKLRSIVEQLRDLIDSSRELGFGEVPYRSDQVMHLEADITRLQRQTGWSPKVPLDQGLRQTVEWYRDHRARYNA